MLFTFIFSLLLTLIQASKTYTDISVISLPQDEGITIQSLTSTDALGYAVKNAGDFNGDGFADVIIGASGTTTVFGDVYVIFGSNTSLLDLTVTSGITSSQGMKITGSSATDKIGYSVSFAGDVNDDGIDDIIIGGVGYSTYKGIVFVIYGSKTPPALLDLSSGLTANQGFKITGAANYNYFGVSVSYAGDVNKDGIDDMIIGATGAGGAYVIFGQAGNSRTSLSVASGLSSTDGFVIKGPSSAASNFGRSVSSAGDIDGDGIDDIMIGGDGVNSGISAVYVIFGKETSKSGAFSTIDLSSSALSSSQGFTISGGSSGRRLGISAAKAGDFNNDGRTDVIIGASGESAAYVIFGNQRSALSDFSLTSGIDPTRGMKIKGAVTGSSFGVSVSRARDINGDGIDDVIIGASLENSSTGKAYVIFGNDNLASEIDLSGSFDGYAIIGDTSGDFLGYSVSTAGDVNGDGLGDLIVGAYGVNGGPGAAYLLFTPFVCPIKCATCETFSVCLSCKTGYGLEGGQCIECPESTKLVDGLCKKKSPLGPVTEVSKGLFDSGSIASRIFTMGRSLSVGLGLIAKIIQNVRFLDIAYDEETLDAFKTYGTDLFEIPIPNNFYESPETKELPSQYSRYDMEPSFLENYWDTIMLMLISLACYLIIKLVQFLTKTQRKDHIMQVSLKNIGQTFANFFIVQIYANLDDVIFYLLLDIQSTRLSSASAGISLAMGIFFLVIGLALVFFHCWLLGRYQKEKSQGNLERFEAKYGILGTLYEDFKDDSIAKHSFFGILIFRCVILILVITLLQPQWMQATLLMLTNLTFLAYFIYYRPFKSRFDEIVQYFCEFTIFAAFLCVLILSIFDASGTEKTSQRNGLGKCIVIAGIVLALGGFIVQMIQLIDAIIGICKFLKNYNSKKERKVKVFLSPIIDPIQNQQNSVSGVSENSSILKHVNPGSVTDQLELMSTSHKRTKRPSQRFPFESPHTKASIITNYDDNNTILNQRIGPGKMISGHEDLKRNQIFDRSLERQIYNKEPNEKRQMNLHLEQAGEEKSTEWNRNSEVRKRKIKRVKREKRERRNLNFSGFEENGL